MKEYIKPNIKSFDACCESLLAGSLGLADELPSEDNVLNQFSKKHGSTSLWDYDDSEEEEDEND